MAQKLFKRLWKFILVIALITCGMIASTGEYAFAKTASTSPVCIPSQINPCRPISKVPNPTPTPDKPHPQAILSASLTRTKELQKDEPHTVVKLRQGDIGKLEKLKKLAPGSTMHTTTALSATTKTATTKTESSRN